MSKHVIAQRKDALELVERLLNRTALTTKKVSHNNVLGEYSSIIAHLLFVKW